MPHFMEVILCFKACMIRLQLIIGADYTLARRPRYCESDQFVMMYVYMWVCVCECGTPQYLL